MRIIFVCFALSLSFGGCFGQQSTPQKASTEVVNALQQKKLELEVKELRTKVQFGWLNQPFVVTVLTLVIGGFLLAD
jgi:hypothetical protein